MPAVVAVALIVAAACSSSPAQDVSSAGGNAGAQALGSRLVPSAPAGARGGATPSAQSTGKAGGNGGGVTPKAVSGGTGAPPVADPAAKPKPRSSAANPVVSAGAGAAGPGSPTPACDATLPAVKDVGITSVQMGRVAADGSIQATSTFSAASDRKIIAVVTLDPQLAVTGTVIDYATIYGCSYHPSDTYTLTKPLTYFYAEFDAATTPFTPGTYHLRFFINGVAAWDVGYTITP